MNFTWYANSFRVVLTQGCLSQFPCCLGGTTKNRRQFIRPINAPFKQLFYNKFISMNTDVLWPWRLSALSKTCRWAIPPKRLNTPLCKMHMSGNLIWSKSYLIRHYKFPDKCSWCSFFLLKKRHASFISSKLLVVLKVSIASITCSSLCCSVFRWRFLSHMHATYWSQKQLFVYILYIFVYIN